MKILHLSDTHGHHRALDALPAADVVVHSGDFTDNGTEDEAIDFIEWFEALPYRYKLFVAGNHDLCLYGAELSGLADGTYCLCGSGVEIEGLKFYGIPGFVQDVQTGQRRRYVADIPDDTDVLITHDPPYSILDYDAEAQKERGDMDLLLRVLKVSPQCHLFGHIHSANGYLVTEDIQFSNAALEWGEKEFISSVRLIELSR